MAEAPSSTGMQSRAEVLANHVQCAICLETYQDPKALACLHTYCRECVQRLVLQQHRDQQVECPQCRSLVPVPGNDVSNLPTVFFINSLIEFYDTLKKAESNEITCQNCFGDKAVAFCQDCEMFICSECVQAHKKMKTFAGHKTLALSEMKRGSLVHLPSKKLPAFTCQKQGHEGELLKLYCFDCQQLICRDCTLVGHRDHRYDFVKTVAAAFKEEVQASLAPLRETHSRVSEAVDKVEEAKGQTENQEADIAHKITESFDHLHAILEEHKQSLLHQAKEMAQKKLGALSEQHQNLQLTQATLESLVDFAERLAENGSDEECVLMKQQISSRIQELREKCSQLKLDLAEEADMIVRMVPERSLREICQKSCITVDVSGLRSSITVNQEAQSTIFTPPSCQTTVAAKLKTVASGSLTPVSVVRKDPSSFELSYTPTTRGRHQLSVRVGNVEIGPFQVFVHHLPTQLGTPVRVIEGVASADRVAIAGTEMLYVTNYSTGSFTVINRSDHRIRKVLPTTAHQATGITTDHDGNIFVASHRKLHKFTKEGELLKVVGVGDMSLLCGIRNHKGFLYVCNTHNSCVSVFDLGLNFVRKFGVRGDIAGQLLEPRDIDFDCNGNAYIVDSRSNQVHVFTETGQYLHSFGHRGKNRGGLVDPRGMCVFYNYVFVTEVGNACVSIFHTSGEFITSFGKGGHGEGEVVFPVGVVVDQDGYVYVGEMDNNCILVF